jgi:hypothetical protein
MKLLIQVRYLYITLLSILFIPLFIRGQNGKINLDSGLVACYPFKGNANDESGNGNNGIVNGATLTTDRLGNPNSAYSFNGQNNYIYAPDNPAFHVKSVALTVWFYPYKEINSTQVILSKVLGSGTWESYCMFFYSYDDIGSVMSDNNGYGNYLFHQMTTVTNTWNFAVYTFDDRTKLNNLYLNGILVASGSQVKSIEYDTHPFQIGAEYEFNVLSYFFYGKLDDIRVYNRALNQSEIQDLYTGNTNCRSCPTVNLGKDTTVCSGGSITLTASGTNTSSYLWTRNGISISSASNSTFNIQHSAFSDSGTYSCIVANGCGSVTSNSVMLTVNTPPVISFFTPPVIKCSRDSVMFKVKLQTSDFGLLASYQWVRKGNNIANASNSAYIVSVITPADTGKYYCYISNICGNTSAYTTLSINTPPFIPDTALNLTSCKGDSMTFIIHPTGTNLSYQWTKNGSIIPGATSNNYQLSTITYNDSGTYSCTVSNICRTTSALVATLNINSCNAISGKVTYDNAANTPVTKSEVYLEDSQGKKLDSAKTEITGAYKILNVSNGTYNLAGGKTAMKWGGCNPVDALTVNRYYVGLIKTFGDELRKTAADINNDGKINPSDALTINWRYVGLIKNFSIPDWLYDSHSVLVSDVSVLQDIKVICAGDVNGSYPR